MLCQWEAQFGDFANGAQVVIDQFITSSESKWQRVSGLVLLLPHGYEGQGPEHSSARLERFLQQCAEDNIQICNITTPANFFHVLRRQMHRDFRKPLVVMSPKSLLRHPEAVSKVEDFLDDTAFQEIIPDPNPPAKTDRVIFCSGKVYYDLIKYREEKKITDAQIIRIEQLYPLHENALQKIADEHRDARLVWCQEESHNMGAWSYIAPHLETIFGTKPTYAGRDAAASPAVGALALHKRELATLLMEAFSL
jgi:2-oxoglutarate dehydrogenase E1 component